MDSNPFGNNGGGSDAFSDPSVRMASQPLSSQPLDSGYVPPPTSAYGGAYDSHHSEGNFYGAMELPQEEDRSTKKGKKGDLSNRPLLPAGSPNSSSTQPHSSASTRPLSPTPNFSADVHTDDLSVREAQLARREQALIDRESALNRKEEMAKATGSYTPNNWPFPCYAITYHSIADEVKEIHKPLCRKFYALLLLTWLCLFWNWIVLLTTWGTGSESGSEVLFGTIYVVLGIPGSWKLWYRPIYYALGSNGTFKWMAFFIVFAAHVIFSALMALGIPDTAGAGLFLIFSCFLKDDNLGGIFTLCSTGVWTIVVLGSVYLLFQAYRIWQGGGGAQQMRKDVAKAAVQEGINSQVNANGNEV